MSWPDLDEITDDTERLLRKNYEDNGFCFQTRLNLSDFITTYFIQQELEQVVLCELVTQLLEKLNGYITSITKKRDTGLFTIRRTLKKTYDNLQASSIQTFGCPKFWLKKSKRFNICISLKLKVWKLHVSWLWEPFSSRWVTNPFKKTLS